MFTMPKPSPISFRTTRPEWLVQFGRRLLIARGQAGLTQQALGAPDLSKSFISLLETGRSHPSVETVVSLARRTRTSVATLLFDGGDLKRETAMSLLHLAGRMDPVNDGEHVVQFIAIAEALQPDMPPELAIRAALTKAHTTMLANRLDEASRWTGAAASLAARHRLSSAEARALAFKGMIAARRGAYAAAIPILEGAVEKMRRAKIARSEECIWALLSLGAARFYLREHNGARRAYQRALDLSTRVRVERLRGRALMGLGLAEWARKHLDPAVELLSQAYDVFERTEDLVEMSRTLNNLGAIRREQGLRDEALKVLERSLRMKGEINDTPGRSTTLDEIALVQFEMHRYVDAARSARRAVALGRAARDAARVASAQATLGRILAAQQRRGPATTLLKTAATAMRRLGLKEQASQTLAELDRVLKRDGAKTAAPRSSKKAVTPGSRVRPAPPAVEGLPLP